MSIFLLNIKKNKSSDDEKTFSLSYSTSHKFEKDKINFDNEKYYILLDGIVLNKTQLQKDKKWVDYIIQSYESNGDTFFKSMKGSYYGFIYDKIQNKTIVFNDHISSKPLYYHQTEDTITFSNNYMELVNHLKKNHLKVSLNQQAAYLLLSYGYVFEDITITNEIKRVLVGNCAVIEQNKITFKQFYELKNDPIKISEQDALEQLDFKFREAVSLAFEKDLEYGYKHLAALSGGLDSRMTVWVAHQLGYTNQLNITFSQSDYLDETIAKKIASDLKHEWLFKALDNGNFLTEVDKVTQITGGNVLYYGLAHGLSLTNLLNFDNLGILHSGQLGDVTFSSFYSSLDVNKPFNIGDGAYSRVLLSKVGKIELKEGYSNEEIFKMYIRGFYGANQGLLATMKYTETYSPFYDIDFTDFSLSVPLEYRFNHKLYKKWIIKKYPQAASYIWEKERVPVNYPYSIKIKGKTVPINQIPIKILHKLGVKQYGFDTPKNMNPLEYWYRTNIDLRNFMDGYFKENIEKLNAYSELKEDCENLFFSGKGSERVQVLSLLSLLKDI